MSVETEEMSLLVLPKSSSIVSMTVGLAGNVKIEVCLPLLCTWQDVSTSLWSVHGFAMSSECLTREPFGCFCLPCLGLLSVCCSTWQKACLCRGGVLCMNYVNRESQCAEQQLCSQDLSRTLSTCLTCCRVGHVAKF